MPDDFTMLASKRSVGGAPKMNLMEYMSPPSVNKAAHSGFETEVQNRSISNPTRRTSE